MEPENMQWEQLEQQAAAAARELLQKAHVPHGGIVVGDDRHVVPPNMPVKMRPLDAPDHIIQLLT